MHGRIESPTAVLNSRLPSDLPEQVACALREDVGPGDITAGLIAARTRAQARVLCREPAVLCGSAWFNEAFRQLDPSVEIRWHFRDGDRVAADSILCELEGAVRVLLTGERTALNFLQLLSGTASTTQRYVAAVQGTACRILDTRKTLPGLRSAQKYAVRCGGGTNHRLGLYDMVMIKENHIAAVGSIAAAVSAARRKAPGVRVEVEAETLEQVREALVAGADIIMLDNFSLEQMRAAVAMNRAHAPPSELECSGGITLESLRTIAETGVDYISVGSLTKHVTAIDLSMRIAATPG
ncbi:MAG TPA: carboxylating nicotinate-nucleotide diphosphorylase [Steroidobacteraceae bacterium]|jgi:nicotinate-nucleotide pyrophosphorylase (carboxylating)|nr:carboxylating nicotinate-nucleotide diphosphorylase [Steroidobacteraceae bacterium]